jgi:hypothetical protein
MLSEITDRSGNRLYFRGSEVFLQLARDARTRKLGEVHGDTLHTVRNLSRHEMMNREEIGFNYELVRYGLFSRVVVHALDGRELRTTRRWILAHGECGTPSRGQYELQVFLRLSEFRGFIEPPPDAPAEPAPRGNAALQGSLFADEGGRIQTQR